MSSKHPPNDEHIDQEMYKLEVNLDDLSPEILGYLMDVLIEKGANDVYYTPIYMKKNRPGTLLQLLCSKSRLEEIKELIFRETTTLGVRYYPLTVHRAERIYTKLHTKWGFVTVKTGLYQGEVIERTPEYEECKKIAQTHGLPLKEVYKEIWRQMDQQ